VIFFFVLNWFRSISWIPVTERYISVRRPVTCSTERSEASYEPVALRYVYSRATVPLSCGVLAAEFASEDLHGPRWTRADVPAS
jgi:hypothetical protein